MNGVDKRRSASQSLITMRRIVIKEGTRFGRLIIAREVDSKRKQRHFLCRCTCGGEKVVALYQMRSGKTRSCGCLLVDTMREMKEKRVDGVPSNQHPLYQTWKDMRKRCLNPKCKSFENYGGRGIKVCDRWSSFAKFVQDMGAKAEGHSLDRIDNNGDYSPSNCKWSTRQDQMSNKRTNRWITYGGETLTSAQWSRRLGGCANRVQGRLTAGWSEERAVSTPVRKAV